MKLNHFDNARQFYERVEGYLLQHEAHHNLMLGISNALMHSPDRYTSQPYLVTVEEDEAILAVAVRTPPYKLVVSRSLNSQALVAITQDLHSRREQLPGVLGTVPEAETFAEAWQAVTGYSYKKARGDRIYQLQAVQPIQKASGYLRSATQCDRELLISWCKAFTQETEGDAVEQNSEAIVDRCLHRASLYLWQDNVPVSMANRAMPTPNGSTINLVYTPPEHRKKGYATSCVATLSQTLLNEGCKYCFLFTDLANPTSNHIYQSIGYQAVCDVSDFQFES